MNEQDLENIKNGIAEYPIEIIISLWALALDEITRRMKK